MYSDPGNHSYEHLITGAKRAIMPDGPSGGIIADEMGLGKSLTMLSAIVGSLAMGQNFAQSVLDDSSDHYHSKVITKATVVLVPSACK